MCCIFEVVLLSSSCNKANRRFLSSALNLPIRFQKADKKLSVTKSFYSQLGEKRSYVENEVELINSDMPEG